MTRILKRGRGRREPERHRVGRTWPSAAALTLEEGTCRQLLEVKGKESDSPADSPTGRQPC